MAVQTNETVKVKVVAPFRVVHQGVAYTDGDVIEVSHDPEDRNDAAGMWLKAKWVEPVAVSQKGQK